jgi:YfiH family protein
MASCENGFRLERPGGVPAYRLVQWAEQPGLVHAIFTRHGGVSRPPYATLNMGHAVGDDPTAVDANHALVCRALGVDRSRMVRCHLVHGNAVRVVTSADGGQWLGQADGMVTGTPGVFLSMRFADCIPILLHDPRRQAVGLAHAGWRGTLINVAGAAVRAMVDELGCRAGDISAVLGPAIGPCCYEVGAEVVVAVEAAFADSRPLLSRRTGQRACFDLWQANCLQLMAAGVGQVTVLERCTACHADQFFSHRAEGGHTGRFGVVIGYRDG